MRGCLPWPHQRSLSPSQVLPGLLEVSHDQRVPGAPIPQYPHGRHHGEAGTGKVCGPGVQVRGGFGYCGRHYEPGRLMGDSLPLTSPPDACRPATWLCVSMASFTGKTPWTRRWGLPTTAPPPPKTQSPRTASCTTRRGPPTWAKSSGRPASWCSGGRRGCGLGLGSARARRRRCWDQCAAQELLGRWRGPILSPGRLKPPVVAAQQQEWGCVGGGQGGSSRGPKAEGVCAVAGAELTAVTTSLIFPNGSNGILYQYPDRTDVTPLLSINMG